GPGGMLLALAGIGMFAAIYHPVGIPWVIRNARRGAGKVLAINGIFGGIGVGMAALVAGNLIDWFGWRWAFILPGAICLATGGVLFLLLSSGRIVEVSRVARDTASVSREARVRAFGILLVTMLISGIVFHATQAAMPKLFDLRLGAILGEGKSGVGILVAAVYFVGAFAQLAGGYMADRWPLKTVYLLSWGAQIPFLWLVAVLGGPLLALVAVLMVSLNSASLPAENLLLSRFTPARHHGLAFGLKFVLAFGAGPLAIQLVARMQSATGEFLLLFQTLTAGAVVVTVVALMLPRGVGAARAAAVSAE
ncbi:MAG: MFS transporter, partial [Alphaproteobacteria bacterium]